MRLMIFGAGFSGRAIAEEMRDRAEWIGGTTRSAEKADALAASNVEPLLFDGEHLGDDLLSAMATATHLVQSIAPTAAGDPLLNLIGNDLAGFFPALRWAGYLSTVGVYGDHGGEWVDEETPCRPVSDRSIMRVASETAWRDAGTSADIPVAVLRLSGIYGPGRNTLVNLAEGRARRLIKPGQVFNRVHVADIAGATAKLMLEGGAGTFNVTDDEPCPPQNPVVFAADLLGVNPPPEQPFDTAALTPMARSFYGENKRVANRRLKSAGYVLRYPNYREGLSGLFNDGNWRG